MASNQAGFARWIASGSLALAAMTSAAAAGGVVADIYLDRSTVLAFVPAQAAADDGDRRPGA